MDLMETLKNRRSVRKYTDQKITDEALEQILSAGMLTPSGKGLKPWQAVVIRDPETLSALVSCRQGGAKMLQTATCAIAVFSDKDKTDTYIEDSSLFMGYMHLMASSLGIGSVWLQIRLRPSDQKGVSSEDFVRDLLSVPENMMPEAILVMGYPESTPEPNPAPEFPSSLVHYEKW